MAPQTMEPAETLRRLTEAVMEPGRALATCGMEMMQLGRVLREAAGAQHGGRHLRELDEPGETGDGIAIAPWRASMCLEDRLRTAAFIRGAVRAIEASLAERPGEPVRLVEAGCGPLATLSAPLLARFGADQLRVTVVDLHRESVRSTLSVLEALGLGDRGTRAICGDLGDCGFGEPADVVVLETMAAALAREPQVALTRRLSRVFPGAVFLPASVAVDLQLVDLRTETASLPPAARGRTLLGRVFTLEPGCGEEAVDGCLAAGSLRIPDEVRAGYGLFLTTRVRVFGDVELADYDSEITLPVEIQDAVADWLGRALRFRYRLGANPGLEWEWVVPA